MGAGVGPLLNAGVAAVAGVGAAAGVGALYSDELASISIKCDEKSQLTQGVDSAAQPVFRGDVQPSLVVHPVFVLPGVAPPHEGPPVGATFLPGVAPPQLLEAPPPLA